MNAQSILIRCSLMVMMAFSALGCVKGPKGDKGADGSGRIISTINCQGQITGLTGAAGTALNGLFVEYTAILTSASDVYATAVVYDDLFQYSATHFYANGQSGADSASVYITADFDASADGGFWRISLNRDTLVTSVRYTDSSLGVQSPVDLNFAASACLVEYF